MPGTRKLGRPTQHRIAMMRGMVTLLLENGQIETTLTRAKEVRSIAEKMITLGKKGTLASRRAALAYITKEEVVKKLFDEIAPKYADVNGGYTQILKTGFRRGDAAEMAIVRLTDVSVESAKNDAPRMRVDAPKAEAASTKVEAAPVAEAPATEAAPAEEMPAEAAPAEEMPAEAAPAEETPAEETAPADAE